MNRSDLVFCVEKHLPGVVLGASGQMPTHVMFSKVKPTKNNTSLWKQDVYASQTGDRMMRSGPVYERVGTAEDPADWTYYAAVTSHGDSRVKIHFRIAKCVGGPFAESLLDILRLFTNQSM